MIVNPPEEAFTIPLWLWFVLGWLTANYVSLALNHRRKRQQ